MLNNFNFEIVEFLYVLMDVCIVSFLKIGCLWFSGNVESRLFLLKIWFENFEELWLVIVSNYGILDIKI